MSIVCKMLTLFTFCIVLISTGLIASSPVPAGSGIYQNFFQGDIKLSDSQKEILSEPKTVNTRTGWTHPFYHWAKNAQGHVIVPYNVDANQGFTNSEIEWMTREFQTVEERTCIRFVRRTNEVDFVDIINGDGCWSWLGRQGGRQEMSLSRAIGCISPGIAVHEAVHALGYDHMHNHVERDSYVRIFWENIDPSFHFAFYTVDPTWFDNFGTPYDLRSVVHYARWAFSTNGRDTIQPLNNAYIDIIGQTQLSDGDVVRLNRMYNC